MTRKLTITSSIFAAALAAISLPGTASAQEACSSYTVQSGDRLSSIAQTAYGTFDYQQIFNANRNEITNPNDIAVGTVLVLPCADGSLPGGVSAQQIIAEQETIQANRAVTSSKFEPPVKIVSGNGWAPFTGEELTGGGMFVRIAQTALQRGGNAREFKMSFVDDWDSHLDTLLPLGAMDISIAWAIPECSNIDPLSDRMKRRCTELDASLPIYESVFGFFAMAGNDYENATSFTELAGARICRPEGWLTFDLEQAGLVDPVITLMSPKGVGACLEMLRDGEADIITLDVETIAGGAKEQGMEENLRQNTSLTSLVSMRFVTHKTNPRGRVYIAMLNRGLTEMRETGEWYAIIADSLSDYNNLTN